MDELNDIYKSLYMNHNSILPRRFIKSLKDNIKCLDINEQNDICEFMLIYIDKLNESISYKLINPVDLYKDIKYNLNNLYDVQRQKMDIEWFKLVKNDYSKVIPLLYGQNITQIVCGNCNKIHHSYDMFSMLTLPLNDKSESIGDCMKRYFCDENLNTKEYNKWTCDKCNESSKSLKTILVWRNPDILMLSIKRFTDDMKKNNKSLVVPLELNISKYTLDKSNSIYKLCSVGNHIGSFMGGHYYSYCLDNNTNSWYIIDDLDVKLVKEPEPPLGDGYIYFYQRV
jgi:ubiquitin C-terminal hydrolase